MSSACATADSIIGWRAMPTPTPLLVPVVVVVVVLVEVVIGTDADRRSTGADLLASALLLRRLRLGLWLVSKQPLPPPPLLRSEWREMASGGLLVMAPEELVAVVAVSVAPLQLPPRGALELFMPESTAAAATSTALLTSRLLSVGVFLWRAAAVAVTAALVFLAVVVAVGVVVALDGRWLRLPREDLRVAIGVVETDVAPPPSLLCFEGILLLVL